MDNFFLWFIAITFLMVRTRTNARNDMSFSQNLFQQLREHKHLLAAPFVLIILAVPRLIITFFTSCMETAHERWLYLLGYFLSFIPTTLIFIIFVLPSKKNKKEFQTNFQELLRKLKRCNFSIDYTYDFR